MQFDVTAERLKPLLATEDRIVSALTVLAEQKGSGEEARRLIGRRPAGHRDGYNFVLWMTELVAFNLELQAAGEREAAALKR
jgi:hypothetical protein